MANQDQSSTLTDDHILDHLKAHFGPDAVLESFEFEPIGVGQGMVSEIRRFRLKWANNSKGDLPNSVIVKVPTIGHVHGVAEKEGMSDVQKDMMVEVVSNWIPMAHNAECRVYEMFNENAPVAIPKAYAWELIENGRPGMIVMEDLSHKAAVSSSFIDGLTYAQALTTVEENARLQAWSLLNTDVDWRSTLPSVERIHGVQKPYLDTAAQAAKEIVDKYPEILGSIDLNKVNEITRDGNVLKIWTEHREIMDDIFVHGDYHMNNILFEKNKDGTVGDRLAALIDWQGAMRGPPTYDLARLFVFSTTQEFRDKHEPNLVRRHYDLMKSAVGDKFKPTFDQIRRWYYRGFVVQAILVLMWIPAMLVLAVKSEGEQRKKDEKRYVRNVLECVQHGIRKYYESG